MDRWILVFYRSQVAGVVLQYTQTTFRWVRSVSSWENTCMCG
jgi:hypothetical protein